MRTASPGGRWLAWNSISQPDGVNASPRFAPTASTVVPSSSAIAVRFTAGSGRWTIVPVGASTSSPSRVKVAWPAITTYTSSWP